MNQQPEDLRSCPFCLGLATLEKIEDRCYGVGCTDCDFQLMNGSVGIGWHESKQEAIAAWNKRGGDLAMSQLRAWVKELQDENTALKAAAQTVEPFGYVNTHTGQFFKEVEPCRKTNEGHWRTVFTAPQTQADAREAQLLAFAVSEIRRDEFAAPQAQSADFQQRVQPWMMACFGPEISADRIERNHRFLEEALELVQSLGCTASEAHQLVDYVFGRPVGEPVQEAGGVMVTLAALCLASGLDMHACGETELARIWTKVEAIRTKQAAKPKHSPLPMHVEQADARDAAVFEQRMSEWSQEDAMDAERYRWVKQQAEFFPLVMDGTGLLCAEISEAEEAIDAAIAAQAAQGGEHGAQ